MIGLELKIDDYLVIGADSDLGKNFYNTLNLLDEVNVKGTSNKNDSDLINFNLMDDFYPFNSPSGKGKAFIFASKPNHKFCELYPLQSHEINVIKTKKLIDYLNKLGWDTIIFSSAQIFSGSKSWMKNTDRPDPISNYGKQKVELENLIKDTEMNLIIRVTKILNFNADPFNSWFRGLTFGRQISPFKDYPISPISIPSLMDGTFKIIENNRNGIWHLGNSEECDYAHIAHLIAEKYNFNQELIKEISPQSVAMENYPMYASLDIYQTELTTNWKAENLIDCVNNAIIK